MANVGSSDGQHVQNQETINNVDDFNIDIWNNLHHAAEQGRLEIVKFFIEKGTKVNDAYIDIDYKKSLLTLLHFAARGGQLEVVKYLVEKGADASASNLFFWATPLHLAARHGHKDVVEFLLGSGVEMEICDKGNSTPLYYAAESGHLEVVKFLIEKGARSYVGNALHLAAGNGHEHVVRYLLDLGVNVNKLSHDDLKLTPLHHAAREGCLEAVIFLTEKGADCNAKDCDGARPIHVAAANGKVEVVEFLVNLGMTVDHGFTTMPCTAEKGQRKVSFYTRRGAKCSSIDAQDEDGKTALHHAIENDSVSTAKRLMELGASPDVTDNDGKTALHYTVSDYVSRKMLRYVLKYQKDLNIKDVKGRTALNYLIRKVSRRVKWSKSIGLLIEAGAYLGRSDCELVMLTPPLLENISGNIKLCKQAVVNRFNNKNLPLLYKLHTGDDKLPPIENLKIKPNSGVTRDIERTIEDHIECFLHNTPISLTLLSVEAYISSEETWMKYLISESRRLKQQQCLRMARKMTKKVPIYSRSILFKTQTVICHKNLFELSKDKYMESSIAGPN